MHYRCNINKLSYAYANTVIFKNPYEFFVYISIKPNTWIAVLKWKFEKKKIKFIRPYLKKYITNKICLIPSGVRIGWCDVIEKYIYEKNLNIVHVCVYPSVNISYYIFLF